ncbi:MAG: hypothetical protein NC411_07305 [Bacteroides sp.]|nr:hypothetical protein [Bacteroides sp.]
MKKILVSLLVGLASFAGVASAAETCCTPPVVPGVKSTIGVFNHLGVGVGVGTDGISFEAATPITRFLALRAGVHIMPNIKFHADTEADITIPGGTTSTEDISIDCGLGRTQGSIILNVYPFGGSFFVAAGGYFSGSKLIKIDGHTDALQGYGGTIEVGDYNVPVDKDGNVRGGLKVKGFRPYLGIGWGRAIPKRLLSFNFELGAQFQGKPEVYTEIGNLSDVIGEADNDFKDYIKYLKVYPTITFRLTGKIF